MHLTPDSHELSMKQMITSPYTQINFEAYQKSAATAAFGNLNGQILHYSTHICGVGIHIEYLGSYPRSARYLPVSTEMCRSW